LKLHSGFALLQTGSQEKASTEALASHARRLALNVVFAQVCWAFRLPEVPVPPQVHSWHHQIKHHDVRTQLLNHIEPDIAIFRLATYL
jgi:hypothetical protein